MNVDVVIFLAALGVLYLGAGVAGSRRRARTCARYGHYPDPDTVGTRGERCLRCGTRLR